jgi:hypothetical protein
MRLKQIIKISPLSREQWGALKDGTAASRPLLAPKPSLALQLVAECCHIATWFFFYERAKKKGRKASSFVNLVFIFRSSSSTTNPVCERRVDLLVCSLPLHRHSYIGFILAFTSSIHNKQQYSLHTRDSSRQPAPSPSLCYSLTHTHRSIGYRNRNPQPLADSSARLMYLRVYDSRVSSHQTSPSPSL